MDDKKNLPGSWRQPTSSLQKFEAQNLRLEAMTTAARRLFSQFKTDATVDPKTYLVAVIAVFERYSDDVIRMVTHPFTGLASKQNWLPTIFEIRQACDSLKSVDDAAAQRERDLAAQMARRKSVKEDTTEAERIAHVARLRAEGKLTFSAVPENERLKLRWRSKAGTEERFAEQIELEALNDWNPPDTSNRPF